MPLYDFVLICLKKWSPVESLAVNKISILQEKTDLIHYAEGVIVQ